MRVFMIALALTLTLFQYPGRTKVATILTTFYCHLFKLQSLHSIKSL